MKNIDIVKEKVRADEKQIRDDFMEKVGVAFDINQGGLIQIVLDYLISLRRKEHKEMAEEYNRSHEEERTFILNVLNGIDIANQEMGVADAGTLAIRSALKSRTIPSQNY
jgi:hypothetical protein